MRRTAAFASALALLAAAVAGCGDIGPAPAAERVDGPAPLTRADVDSHPQGSPARTVFEWWRALQFDDAAAATGFYSRRVGVTTKEIDDQLGNGLEPLGIGRRPQLVEVDREGDRATVLVIFRNVTTNPNGRTDVTRTGRAFSLVREGGEWKLSDNRYLDRSARAVEAYVRQTRQPPSAPGQ